MFIRHLSILLKILGIILIFAPLIVLWQTTRKSFLFVDTHSILNITILNFKLWNSVCVLNGILPGEIHFIDIFIDVAQENERYFRLLL